MFKNTKESAYFLWVGGSLPKLSKVCILSAADAGFKTTLYVDREQDISHKNLKIENWKEVGLDWAPDDVTLKGRKSSYYAGFANLFRYKLLSMYDGWWFDCDTFILKPVSYFSSLLGEEGKVVFGYESDDFVNNAVIGSRGKRQMSFIYESARPYYPHFKKWGVTGPKLITKLVNNKTIHCDLLESDNFYPVSHQKATSLYDAAPKATIDSIKSAYCLTLWGEMLSKTGLKYTKPPAGSVLNEISNDYPLLKELEYDNRSIVKFLIDNSSNVRLSSSKKLMLARLFKRK